MDEELYSVIDDEDEDDEDEAIVEEEEELSTRTYKLDLDSGRIVGFVDGLEAVEQAIRKAILTPRFKCLIYSDQYGSEIEDAIIVKDASDDYIRAAIQGFVEDALSADSRVISISDVDVDISGDAAYIFFSCETIYGEVEIEEELGNGNV